MSKPKIFIGIIETGNFTLQLAQGLRELGYDVTNIVIRPKTQIISNKGHTRYIRNNHPFFLGYDIVKEFFRSIFSHDVFIFNYSTSFFGLLSYSKLTKFLSTIDLIILKKLGKKIIFLSSGSDTRSYELLIEDLKRKKLFSHAKYLERNLNNIISRKNYSNISKRRTKIIEKYADHFFNQPNMAQFFTKNYHFFWVPIDLRNIEYKINNNQIPIITHAPSKRALKGTSYVLDAIEKLKKENYKFEFILCENRPNEKVREALSQSDIVIDQLLLPSYGLFGIEAMATGNAVLGSAVANYNNFPKELPIITTTPGNIYENLKKLIENPNLRIKLAKQGRQYVEKYHDHKKVTKDFLKKIDLS